MDSINKNILVPWDFTPSSSFALEHAVKIAKIRNYNISLLHIVKNTKEETKYQDKLKEIANETHIESALTPEERHQPFDQAALGGPQGLPFLMELGSKSADAVLDQAAA